MSQTRTAQVGILMGSDSDWPKIRAAAAALDEFDIAYETRVMSAHRTPQLVREYAVTAASRGLKLIIAAAGGAAHLAGTVAAHTTLPVPVATVGLGSGGARNAGLLAVQILALGDAKLQERLGEFRRKLAEKVQAKDRALQAARQNETTA